MRSPEEIAWSYMGTPFGHQGRKPGELLDCAGVLICIARELQLCAPDFDVVNYAQQPDKTSIHDACDKYLIPVRRSEMAPSCVVTMEWDRWPQHLGIIGRYPSNPDLLCVIHAFARQGETDARVTYHRLAPHIQSCIKRVYKFPEVAWQH